MKEKLFTVTNSNPKFIINPELTEYLHTTGDIRMESQDDVYIRRNYELICVNETQCYFVKNKIEQLIIGVSNMTEQEYDKTKYLFRIIDIDGDIIKIPIFIQTDPKSEYTIPQWFDVNAFIQLTLRGTRPEFNFKCVVESFKETDEHIVFIARYLLNKVPYRTGGSYGRFENCCVNLDKKTGEVKVDSGYDPRSQTEHVIHIYKIGEVFVEQYELPQF